MECSRTSEPFELTKLLDAMSVEEIEAILTALVRVYKLMLNGMLLLLAIGVLLVLIG